MQAAPALGSIIPSPCSGLIPSTSAIRAHAYTEGRHSYPEEIFLKITSVIGPGAKVLDLGCGNGRSAIPLTNLCQFQVTGFDFDTEMLKECQNNIAKTVLSRPIALKQGYVKDLKAAFPYERFRAVTAFSACTLFYDDESLRAIREMVDVGGYFIDAGDEGPRSDPIGNLMREIFRDTLQIDLSKGTNGPSPDKRSERDRLLENLFLPRDELSFEITRPEYYTVEQVFANFRSRMAWPNCTSEQEKQIYTALKIYFSKFVRGDSLSTMVTYRVNFYQVNRSRL